LDAWSLCRALLQDAKDFALMVKGA